MTRRPVERWTWDQVRDEIRRVISPEALLRQLGAKLQKAGHSYKTSCPWHPGEKTPSCHIYDDHVHAFDCGTTGDIFDIWIALHGGTQGDALRVLAEMAGVRLPEPSPEDQVRHERRARVRDVVEFVASMARDRLQSGDERAQVALAWLRSRGITEATARTTNLGVLAGYDDARKALYGAGGDEAVEAALAAGLLRPSQKEGRPPFDALHHSVVFPILRAGRVETLIGRIHTGLLPEEKRQAKSLKLRVDETTPDAPPVPSVWWPAGRRPPKDVPVVAVEGEIDALSLFQAGFEGAVALLGTAAAGRPEVAQDLCGAQKDRMVYCLPDRDRAGADAAQKLAAQIGNALRIVEPAPWIERGHKDANDALMHWVRVSEGNLELASAALRTELEAAIVASVSWFEWEARRLHTQAGDDRLGLADLVVDRVVPVVATIREPVHRAEAVRLVAQATRLRAVDLTQAVTKAQSESVSTARRAEASARGHLRVIDGGGEGAASGGGDSTQREQVMLRGDLEDKARTVIAWLEERQRREGWQLFQRGGTLVRIAPRRDGVQVEPMDADRLVEHCTSRARFYIHKGEETELVDFPPRLASYILAKPSWRAVPSVETVYRSPVMAPDGSLVVTSGYHEALEAWVDVGDLVVPHVPERPTDEDLARARELLEVELLGDFSFDGDASRANALAYALFPIVRPLVRCPSPLYVFSAPTEGSGKGLLSSVLSEAAVGREPVSMSESRDDDEWRKRITSTLAQAPSCIRIDNVNRKLDSGALASVLTSTWWTDRALGRSENVTYRNDAVWTLTANNPSLSPELGRRSCWIRIQPECARPNERRNFRHPNLALWARENHGQLVWALLVLVRHWMATGARRGPVVMGSYEDWAAVLGGILDAAGINGFMTNRDAGYRQSGADAGEWRAFFEAWWSKHRDADMGVAALAELAAKEGLLDEVLGDKGVRSQRTKLGMAVSRRVDRIDDLFPGEFRAMSVKLVRSDGPKAKVATYQLIRVVPATDAGAGVSAGRPSAVGGDLWRPSVLEGQQAQVLNFTKEFLTPETLETFSGVPAGRTGDPCEEDAREDGTPPPTTTTALRSEDGDLESGGAPEKVSKVYDGNGTSLNDSGSERRPGGTEGLQRSPRSQWSPENRSGALTEPPNDPPLDGSSSFRSRSLTSDQKEEEEWEEL